MNAGGGVVMARIRPRKVMARILCTLGLHRWVDLEDGIRFCPRCGARRWQVVLRVGENAEIPTEKVLR